MQILLLFDPTQDVCPNERSWADERKSCMWRNEPKVQALNWKPKQAASLHNNTKHDLLLLFFFLN